MKHFETKNQLVNICFIFSNIEAIIQPNEFVFGELEDSAIEIAEQFNKEYPDNTSWEDQPEDFESTCYEFTEAALKKAYPTKVA